MGGSSAGLLAVLLLWGLPSLWAPGPAANRKGNDAYRKGNYPGALSQYNKAMETLPGERALSLNAGTALLQQKKYEEALRSLITAAGDPRPAVKSRALYNAGNGLVDLKKLEEALTAYRQAILTDPRDEDAKFNYELARRLMQAQQQQQQQGGDSKDQQEQRGGDQQQQPDQAPQQAPQQPDPNQPPPAGEQPPPENREQPASLLSKQEAERLLDAVKANEAELIKARLKSKRKKDVEKDW